MLRVERSGLVSLLLGQMVEHVAQLVRTAALHWLMGAEDCVDGGSERLRSINVKEHLAFRIDATSHDVFEQFLDHRGVLRGSLADAQHVLVPFAIHAHRAHHRVVAEQQPVDVDHQQLQLVEAPRAAPQPRPRKPRPPAGSQPT